MRQLGLSPSPTTRWDVGTVRGYGQRLARGGRVAWAGQTAMGHHLPGPTGGCQSGWPCQWQARHHRPPMRSSTPSRACPNGWSSPPMSVFGGAVSARAGRDRPGRDRAAVRWHQRLEGAGHGPPHPGDVDGLERQPQPGVVPAEVVHGNSGQGHVHVRREDGEQVGDSRGRSRDVGRAGPKLFRRSPH